MVRRLKREGASARSQFDQPLCDRIMRAVDGVEQEREAHQRESFRRKRVSRAAMAVVAVALLVGIGLNMRPDAQVTQREMPRANVHLAASPNTVPVAVSRPEIPADDLFSAPAVAMDSLSALQADANPLDEFTHDAQLAGQMALSALPWSGLATD